MNASQIQTCVILALTSYLLGAIPFGYLIGKAKGVDIRQHGSGNIGATNLGRVLGRKWGYLGFILDVAKGLLPALYAGRVLGRIFTDTDNTVLPHQAQWAWLIIAAAAIVGHMFPIYLRFKGGKGVATSLGVVLGIFPYFTLTAAFALLIWIGVWGMTKYVSLASIIAAIAFPVGFALIVQKIDAWQLKELWPLFLFACLMGALIIIRHRTNIARLLKGTENRTAGLRGAKPQEKE